MNYYEMRLRMHVDVLIEFKLHLNAAVRKKNTKSSHSFHTFLFIRSPFSLLLL